MLYARPEQRKVCFVLTDGMGNFMATREHVQSGARLGVSTIGIGINAIIGSQWLRFYCALSIRLFAYSFALALFTKPFESRDSSAEWRRVVFTNTRPQGTKGKASLRGVHMEGTRPLHMTMRHAGALRQRRHSRAWR
jgi:hypothetical protein